MRDLARFWSKVDKRGPDECWPWLGATPPRWKNMEHGYGHYQTPLGRMTAHRYSYILANGGIGADLVVDHLCRNPRCVNPAHLEAVSSAENVLRGISPSAMNARKTHCKHGHPFEGHNLMIRPNGQRECRTCRNLTNSRTKKRKRERAREARNA